MLGEQKHIEFLQVGDFVENFGGNELEHTDDLVGRSFDIHFENDRVVRYSFQSNQKMEWQVIRGVPEPETPEKDQEIYCATSLRDGYYLVDFVKRSNSTRTVTLVIDLFLNVVTAVVAAMPTREETYKPLFQRVIDREPLTPVKCQIVHGSINQPFSEQTPKHNPTEEMVGKRVRYQYGPIDSYEHIYLSREFYTWNCIQGPEAGLADTDYCRYYKLGENFYLFVWLEKVIPTIGVILVDFKRAKTSGKIFGYQGDDFGATCNTQVGASLTLLNVTKHRSDEGVELSRT